MFYIAEICLFADLLESSPDFRPTQKVSLDELGIIIV